MMQELKFYEDAMCLSADTKDNIIVVGHENGHLNIWDTLNSENKPVLHGSFVDKEDVTSVIFTHANPYTIYVATGKFIRVLDTRKVSDTTWTDNEFVCEDEINQIDISENDQILAVADDDNCISLFDLMKSNLITRLNRHKNCVSTVKFRQSKQRQLISGGYDCMLFQWDVLKGRNLSSSNLANLDDLDWELPKSFNPSYVLTCDIASIESEEICVAGTENGNLHLFRCEKKLNHIKTFHAHDQGVTQAKYFCINEPMIFTGSNDMKIKIWPLNQLIENEKSTPLKSIEHHSKINWMTFSKTNLVLCDTSPHVTIQPIEL